MANRDADITLLLEGTYPLVRGGVSGWVHQIIQGLPQFKFSLIFLGSKSSDYEEPKYALPSNVVHLECHYLWDGAFASRPKARPGNNAYFLKAEKFHEWFRNPRIGYDDELARQVLTGLGQDSGCTAEDFFYSEAAWEQLCASHQRFCAESSFINYIWTVRAMHAPLFKLASIAQNLTVTTGLFHSVSTGYAGFLGTILRHTTGRPLILTEHGIYTKERKIDLQSIFIREHRDYLSDAPDKGMKYYDQLWIHYFESLGRLTYCNANPIISLYERNRQRQIADGADAARTKVIPNGMNVAQFVALRERRPDKIPPVIGLLGRIVPIKDIKTFIRAMRSVVSQFPDMEGWIIGPEEEDPEYAYECKSLVHNLGLERNVRFLGFQKISDILPQVGLLVLTSISEAFPLVLLEAFASGIPVVTTDVGGCREVIEGNSEEDRALGAAGIVVPIADPEAVARACIALLTDEAKWYAAQRAGISRVERYYTEDIVLSDYMKLYTEALES
ncbi:GT4 family glycosyltransferase PelF [Methylobacter sp. Wu1]|uniref:GT4 family glycosyltransferase PelF n=1 Tax=Methylobacter sp. Wu1 TaxID=3119359 RepID=UPI002F93966B